MNFPPYEGDRDTPTVVPPPTATFTPAPTVRPTIGPTLCWPRDSSCPEPQPIFLYLNQQVLQQTGREAIIQGGYSYEYHSESNSYVYTGYFRLHGDPADRTRLFTIEYGGPDCAFSIKRLEDAPPGTLTHPDR